MALEIVWTKQAERGYAKVIDYLRVHFSEKEIRRFVNRSGKFFELLSQYPEILQRSAKYKYVHRGPLNKYTILTYRIKPKKKQIQFLSIRFSRQKPFP